MVRTAGSTAPDSSTPTVTGSLTSSSLAIPETRQIVTRRRRGRRSAASILRRPATASRCSATPRAGEGIGFIRPVYDFDYWNSTRRLDSSSDWRFGGGAGEVDFGLPSKDTDTRDPNAIDIIVGVGQTQAQVMDWQSTSPVALPMIPLQ